MLRRLAQPLLQRDLISNRCALPRLSRATSVRTLLLEAHYS
jgi:hypothetical protein